jgi:hypothetical protein
MYVSDDLTTSEKLRKHISGQGHRNWQERDRDRLVEERQHKWTVNAAQLIEFFSSLGLLVGVAAADSSNAGRPTLAGIGYAAGTSIGGDDSSSSSTAQAVTSSSRRTWLQQVGWCCSSTGRLRAIPAARPLDRMRSSGSSGAGVGITATLIDPVVSSRLVTSKAERDAVLQCATACTGLLCESSVSNDSHHRNTCSSTSSSSVGFAGLMPVPCQSAVSATDAHWLAVPGRYCVSLKLDGTRHLLIATDSGCYLLNRAGMVYKYPVAAAVTPSLHCRSSSSSSSRSTSTSSTSNGQTADNDNNITSSSASSSTKYSAHKGGAGCSVLGDTADSTGSPAATAATVGTTTTNNNTTNTTSSSSSSSSSSGTNSLLRADQNAAAAAADSAAAATSAATVSAGTVLDGELLWLSSGSSGGKRGCFVAFDALAVAGTRVWQLPLQQRLAAMQQQLALPQASDALGLLTAGSSGAIKVSQGEADGQASTSVTSSSSSSSSSGGPSAGSTTSGGAAAASVETRLDTPTDGDSNAVSSSTSAPLTLLKKQQAALIGKDSITLLFKPHHSVSTAALQQLQASLPSFPFPTDGLVFTPATMPYVLGMNQLLVKWQPQQQAAADIRGIELKQLFTSRWYSATASISRADTDMARAAPVKQLVEQLPNSFVYECCQLLPFEDNTESSKSQPAAGRSAARNVRRQRTLATEGRYRLWRPLSVRWDKSAGNNPAVRAQLEQQGLPGSVGAPLTHEQLAQAVWEVESLVTTATATPNTTSNSSTSVAAPGGAGAGTMTAAASPVHPAKTMPFDELYAAVQAEVEAGTVHCTTDPASGLQIFCYDLSLGPPSSSTAAMCRGLVLHPASSSVVVTPFARFGGPSSVPAMQWALAAAAASGSAASGSASGSVATGKHGSRGRGGRDNRSGRGGRSGRGSASATAAAAKASKPDPLQLYKTWSASPQGSASVKVDGSFVLAFLWQGQLQVATRRRMDSEQVRGGCCMHRACS